MFFLLLLGAYAQNCTLLPGSEAGDPNPSLVKCYRQNGEACCVSAHDQAIQSSYSSLFPSQCQREYDNMEDYFCFGCHPSQGQYTFQDNMTILLCSGYARSVWGDSLDKPTTSYDNCGMYTYWRSNPQTVIPSLEWKNAYEFFNEVKPTFFENYTIVIVEGDFCYNNEWKIEARLAFVAIWLWIIGFLI
ncbi:unnamed protein product [Blepharisma stoltei]|uniref:Uncharacterized protein n=1 Tax=Blepharisma stoltei TaxID=1481888 RepID=A0AAU9JCN5_9CILI|nr:unnamed protein product [Blepharisma stoltei]